MKRSNILLFCFVISCNACCGQQKEREKKNKLIFAKYVELEIDRTKEGNSVPGDWDPYFGPASMDVDSTGCIYLVNMNNSVQKFSKTGKRLWSTNHNSQQLDIKFFNGAIFSFDGKNIYTHTADSGNVIDTVKIEIEKNDYTPIGNVSKFYGKYLFISKWRNKGNRKLVYVYDMQKKQVSPA